MFAPRPDSVVFPCFASVHFAYWLAWGGSLALSVALVVLMWTRWGQSRPLQKCAALSLLVHLILAFLAMTVRIVAGDGSGGGGGGAPIHVRIVQESGTTATAAVAATEDASKFSAPELLEPPPRKEATNPQAADVQPPAAELEQPPLQSKTRPRTSG